MQFNSCSLQCTQWASLHTRASVSFRIFEVFFKAPQSSTKSLGKGTAISISSFDSTRAIGVSGTLLLLELTKNQERGGTTSYKYSNVRTICICGNEFYLILNFYLLHIVFSKNYFLFAHFLHFFIPLKFRSFFAFFSLKICSFRSKNFKGFERILLNCTLKIRSFRSKNVRTLSGFS